MTANKLAMIDLDGTLINRDYQVTDPSICSAITEAQEAGWTISLNSDTPLVALKIWRDRLGCNGPTIAEKGAVVELPYGPSINNSDANKVTVARRALVQRLQASGVQVWSGNPVEALRNDLRLSPSYRTAVLVNSLSQCSLRYFVRAVASDGSLYQDKKLFRTVQKQSRDLYPAFSDLTVEANAKHSLVIAASATYNKRLGAEKLLKRLHPSRCVMIGDTVTDYIGNDVAEHYAVGNASAAFKRRADYVASQPTTAGVAEILRRLIAD